jgi:sugar fermentation stimulation protein A
LGSCYIEVKSVTLVEDGVGLFPDAPTERGRKHVSSLRRIVRSGHRAAAVFVVQRPDARAFSPNRLADPDFCRALSEAVESGVETHAFRCRVSRARIELWDAVPVRMP